MMEQVPDGSPTDAVKNRPRIPAAVVVFVALLVLAIVANWSTLGCAFVMDDLGLIHRVSQRGPLGHFTFPPTDYLRPLTSVGFWVDWKLFGLAPLGYHLTNVLAEALTALALWLLLGQIAPSDKQQNWDRWRLAAAIIFLFLPSHVEPVSWASASSDLWMGFFVLLAIFLFVRELGKGKQPWLAYGAFIVALGFKETALAAVVAAPVLALACRRDIAARRVWQSALPILVVAVGYYFLRSAVVGDSVSHSSAASMLSQVKPSKVAGNIVYYPLRTLTGGLPYDRMMGVDYPTDQFGMLTGWLKSHLAIAGLGLVAALMVAVLLLKEAISAGMARILASLLFAYYAFCGPLLALYVSPLSSESERYLYLPSAFLVASLVLCLSAVRKQAWAIVPASVAATGMVWALWQSQMGWRRGAELAADVYRNLGALATPPLAEAPSIVVIVNAPNTLRGYPVAGDCLDDAMADLYPQSKIRVATLSHQVQTAENVDVAVDKGQVSIGPGGYFGDVGFVASNDLGLPPAELQTLKDRFTVLPLDKKSFAFQFTPAPNIRVAVYSNGQFRYLK